MNNKTIDELSQVSRDYSDVEHEVVFVMGEIQQDVLAIFNNLTRRFSIHKRTKQEANRGQKDQTVIAWIAIQKIPEIVRELSKIDTAIYQIVFREMCGD